MTAVDSLLGTASAFAPPIGMRVTYASVPEHYPFAERAAC